MPFELFVNTSLFSIFGVCRAINTNMLALDLHYVCAQKKLFNVHLIPIKLRNSLAVTISLLLLLFLIVVEYNIDSLLRQITIKRRQMST